jgi:hypothetical protein
VISELSIDRSGSSSPIAFHLILPPAYVMPRHYGDSGPATRYCSPPDTRYPLTASSPQTGRSPEEPRPRFSFERNEALGPKPTVGLDGMLRRSLTMPAVPACRSGPRCPRLGCGWCRAVAGSRRSLRNSVITDVTGCPSSRM